MKKDEIDVEKFINDLKKRLDNFENDEELRSIDVQLARKTFKEIEESNSNKDTE